MFKFSEGGHCENPEIPFRLHNEGGRIEIRLCSFDDAKWSFGLTVGLSFGNYSVSSWPCCNDIPMHAYSNRHAAESAAAESVAKLIKHEKRQNEPQFAARFNCFAPFWAYYNSLSQLTLF